MTSGKYIQTYKKIKLENEKLKRKLKEIKELVSLANENDKDILLKICKVIMF